MGEPAQAAGHVGRDFEAPAKLVDGLIEDAEDRGIDGLFQVKLQRQTVGDQANFKKLRMVMR